MLPPPRRLNRLAIAALAAATCGFPAAALAPVASGDPALPLVTPAPGLAARAHTARVRSAAAPVLAARAAPTRTDAAVVPSRAGLVITG
jgi:hypothetical protein